MRVDVTDGGSKNNVHWTLSVAVVSLELWGGFENLFVGIPKTPSTFIPKIKKKHPLTTQHPRSGACCLLNQGIEVNIKLIQRGGIRESCYMNIHLFSIVWSQNRCNPPFGYKTKTGVNPDNLQSICNFPVFCLFCYNLYFSTKWLQFQTRELQSMRSLV